MKQTYLDKETNGLTDRLDSQRKEVLFFPTAHFLFFNFLAAAQVAHFVLPQPHKPTQRQNKKSQIANALFGSEANYLCKILPLLNDIINKQTSKKE